MARSRVEAVARYKKVVYEVLNRSDDIRLRPQHRSKFTDIVDSVASSYIHAGCSAAARSVVYRPIKVKCGLKFLVMFSVANWWKE